MHGELIVSPSPRHPAQVVLDKVPALFSDAGARAAFRVVEFFTANISNKNTRTAYALAVGRFAEWCQARRFGLRQLTPVHVAAYIEELGRDLAKPSVKQHLAAIRMLFDFLVTGQVVRNNPAASVRGPKYVVKKGKTPVLTVDEARALLAAMEPKKKQTTREQQNEPEPEWTLSALRDRALIGVMVYSFARIGAVLGMNVEDYYQQGKRWWIRLTEKGGKHHEVPAHHKAEEFLDAYLQGAGIAGAVGTPLFRSINAKRRLTGKRLVPRDALAMIKRRALAADLGNRICCHTFRATGITAYLQNGGSIEKAMAIAAHASPRTTKLYDRTSDEVSLDEIERIQI